MKKNLILNSLLILCLLVSCTKNDNVIVDNSISIKERRTGTSTPINQCTCADKAFGSNNPACSSYIGISTDGCSNPPTAHLLNSGEYIYFDADGILINESDFYFQLTQVLNCLSANRNPIPQINTPNCKRLAALTIADLLLVPDCTLSWIAHGGANMYLNQMLKTYPPEQVLNYLYCLFSQSTISPIDLECVFSAELIDCDDTDLSYRSPDFIDFVFNAPTWGGLSISLYQCIPEDCD